MGVAVETETGEFSDAELFAQDAIGVIALEGPVIDAAFDAAQAVEERVFGGFEELRGAGEKRFAGVEELEFVAEGFFGGSAEKFGALKFSSGEIDEGEADRGGILVNGSEEVIFFGVEHG